MRPDEPSLSARGVALARRLLERPATPTGDPGAEDRLTDGLIGDPAEVLALAGPDRNGGAWIVVRTPFFDDAVLGAVRDCIGQVVILGAGYDGRALRFRSPGVRFVEVDHPATHSDKRRRLADAGIDASDVGFLSFDLIEPGLDAALIELGFDPAHPALFTVEGLLRYLPEHAFRGLLATTAALAAPGSRLAASVSTSPDEPAAGEAVAQLTARFAAGGEPVLTVPTRSVALAWLAEAGWSVTSVVDAAERDARVAPGRLLVAAVMP
jgi:methyltransferase (TIGR00027 family)